MCIILEQSLEWNHLSVSFIDYEKVFDSLDRQTLWKLLGHYGLLDKITKIISNTYKKMSCRVIQGGQTTYDFQVQIHVGQGGLLSHVTTTVTMK